MYRNLFPFVLCLALVNGIAMFCPQTANAQLKAAAQMFFKGAGKTAPKMVKPATAAAPVTAVADDALRAAKQTAKNSSDDVLKNGLHSVENEADDAVKAGNKNITESKLSDDVSKAIDKIRTKENIKQIVQGDLSGKDKAFMQRYPEVDLSRIPKALRPPFMNSYEKLRPKLDGTDIIMLCNDEEITLVCKAKYRIEKLERVDLDGGGHLTVVRIINGGKQLHKDVCHNFFEAFISGFLEEAKGN